MLYILTKLFENFLNFTQFINFFSNNLKEFYKFLRQFNINFWNFLKFSLRKFCLNVTAFIWNNCDLTKKFFWYFLLPNQNPCYASDISLFTLNSKDWSFIIINRAFLINKAFTIHVVIPLLCFKFVFYLNCLTDFIRPHIFNNSSI